MQKTIVKCYKCGKEINSPNNDDCWNNSFHAPFDTVLRIKELIKDHCICESCFKILKEKASIK